MRIDFKKDPDRRVLLRQKSASFMLMEDACNAKKMTAYFREQKTQSDFELLDLGQAACDSLKFSFEQNDDRN